MKKQTEIMSILIVMALSITNAAALIGLDDLKEDLAQIELTPGEQGFAGINGTNGVNGTNGINGTDGKKGDTGARGARGRTGNTGASGSNGVDGADGYNGTNGMNGSNFNGVQLTPVKINGSSEVLFQYGSVYFCYFARSSNARHSMLYQLNEHVPYMTGDWVRFHIDGGVIIYD